MRDFIQLPVILCSYGFFIVRACAFFVHFFFGKLLKKFLIQLSFKKSSFDQTKKKKNPKTPKNKKLQKPHHYFFKSKDVRYLVFIDTDVVYARS